MNIAKSPIFQKFILYALLTIFACICYRVVTPKWVINFPYKYHRFSGKIFIYSSISNKWELLKEQ